MIVCIPYLHYEARETSELPRTVSDRHLFRIICDIVSAPEGTGSTLALVSENFFRLICHCPFLNRNQFFNEEPVGSDLVCRGKLSCRIILVYREGLTADVAIRIGLNLIGGRYSEQ